MKILVTGAAGFIGYHLVLALLKEGHEVIGLDNLNDYYSVKLKLDRLEDSGISVSNFNCTDPINSNKWENYFFHKLDIENTLDLDNLFNLYEFDIVVHLAAQAGVRYSLENPRAYVNTNIVGFFNIMELSKKNNVKRIIYASSSSVYGLTDSLLFSINDKTDTPASLYAATKKANELMAHVYSNLYNIETIGLRFFTVYGPWGRPDMAPFLFSDAISNGNKIKVFNGGKMQRDFTYVGDIVEGIVKLISVSCKSNYSIYNIGNSKPVQLLDFIKCLEEQFKTKALLEMCDMQPGDVVSTWADVKELNEATGYSPETNINDGVKLFIDWYKTYFNIK